MRIKRIIMLGVSLILVLSVLFAFGCAKPAPAPAPAPAPKPAPAPAPAPTPAPAPAPAPAKTVTWKMLSTGNYAEWMTRELRDTVFPAVTKNTNGAVKIDMFVQGEHPYDRADSLKAVKDGAFQIAYASGGYISGAEPHMTAMELPMLMPADLDLSLKVMEAVQDQIWKPTFDKWGVQKVMTIVWPAQRIAARVPITSWDALKGQKIRAWSPELIAFVNMLGGTGISMNFGEVAAALATGLVDGCISNSGIMYDSGFYEQLKYVNITEIQFGLPWLVVGKSDLAKLPADIQKIVIDTLKEYEPYIIQGGVRDADVKALKATVDYGTTLVSFPKAMRKEIEAKAREVIWPAWAKQAGAEGTKAIEIIEAAKAKLLK